MVSVCLPLIPSCNTYHLTWVSVTLGMVYLFTAAPADILKPYSQKPSQSNHTRTTALSNSMKLSHARGATQDGRVMVERSDRMWSTGEGNGKPLQYSCLANLMNRMKRQNDRILKEELPRSVGAQYITPERMKGWSQSKNNTQLWM